MGMKCGHDKVIYMDDSPIAYIIDDQSKRYINREGKAITGYILRHYKTKKDICKINNFNEFKKNYKTSFDWEDISKTKQ